MSILDLQIDQQPIEIQRLKSKMEAIQASLLSDTPGLSEALKDIHQNIQQHEDLVHLLSDEEMNLVHRAFEKHKQVKMIQEAVDKPRKNSKKLSKDDLLNL